MLFRMRLDFDETYTTGLRVSVPSDWWKERKVSRRQHLSGRFKKVLRNSEAYADYRDLKPKNK